MMELFHANMQLLYSQEVNYQLLEILSRVDYCDFFKKKIISHLDSF